MKLYQLGYEADGSPAAWWVVLALRGLLPALFAISMGVLIGAVQRGAPLVGPFAAMGGVFTLLQVLAPFHQAIDENLGGRTISSRWLASALQA